MSLLLAGLPGTSPLPVSQAQTQATPPPLRIPLVVSAERATLPVTVGVPIAESSNVADANVLGIVSANPNANDDAVPSQMRVLARWRGPATDASKLVKWVLVDFKPTLAGTYYLTRTAQSVPANMALVRSESAASIRLKNSQLEIELPKTGAELVRSFKLGESEMLRAPITLAVEAPSAALITRIDSVTTRLTVADASVFRKDNTLKFVFNDTLKWTADAGSKRLVTIATDYIAGHRYVIDDGIAAKREEFVIESIASPQDNRIVTPLTRRHEAGAKIRDLTIENETVTVRSISDQTVNFTAALANVHAKGEKMYVVANGLSQNQNATMTLTGTRVEEFNALRAVVRQDGFLTVNSQRLFSKLDFVVRYYVYADQPFVRVRVQTINNGVYGFGADRLNKAPFAQHLLLRSLSALIPTNATGNSTVQALTASEARTIIQSRQNGQNGQSGATLSVGSGASAFELGVPEFAENYPKCIKSTSSGLRFDLLPNLGASEAEYVFDGARAKTTDFYLGRSVNEAQRLTTGLGAKVDAAHVARTGAVRPAMVEKRNWSQPSAQSLGANAEMTEAAARYEQMMASAYDLASCYGTRPQSMFEYRNSTEFGEQLGWRNFGDLGWGDGYANLHYDLPFLMLREYLRTGDARAFQLGNDQARYLANWGVHHSEDFGDEVGNVNFRGMSFYEKGDHGSYSEPKPSHMWVEGMWLHWALTGDETSRESALAGSDAFKRMGFTFDNALSWNEPRWVGWPILGLMAAWRYTGEMDYLAKARDNTYLMVQAEEVAGRKGYFIATGVEWANKVVQPWVWTGYAQQGPIEFWRETQDQRVAQYLVRVADWFVGDATPNNRPLAGGVLQADGKYLPLATSYFWEPGKTNDDRGVLSGGMGLQVLVAAARITNRQDLWAKSSQLFRDTVFFRDLGYGPMTPTTRATISFRSAQYTSSSTKVYGQTALTANDYLPELLGAVVLPRTGVTIPPSAVPSPTPPNLGGGGGETPPPPTNAAIPPFITGPKTDGLINAVLKKPATASSVKGYPDVTGDPASGNDGLIRSGSRISLWHSAVNTGNLEWWQVDLQTQQRLMAFELTFRPDVDQPVCRRNFEILGSNDPTFATAVILASRGEQPVPFGKPFKVGVRDKNKFRYLRVRKNKVERDASNQQFFNLVEVKAFVRPTPPPPAALDTSMSSLTNVALNRIATSSTFQAWADVTGEDRTANDGLIQVASKASAWHSESNTGQLEWVQVDLGQPYRVKAVETLARQDIDQPLARRNFVVLGSTNDKFDNPVVLAMRDDVPFAFGEAWMATVTNTNLYRYIRVMKTDWDDVDASGQQFFNVAEVRVYADLNVQTPTALTALTDQPLKVGQSYSVLIKKTDEQNRVLTLTATGVPENAVWDATRGFFSFTPHSGQTGRMYPIYFTGTATGVAPRTVRTDIVVTYDGTPSVVLTAPTITTAMVAGQPVSVRWAISPSSATPVRYRVFLSADSGQTFIFLGEASGNTGLYRWNIPLNYPVNTPLRFMVQALDASNRVGLDYNKQDLRVGPPQTASN